MPLSDKRVLVTGAGGFIGSHLCEALVKTGAKVRAFVRYNSRNDRGMLEHVPKSVKAELEYTAGDLKDPEAVRRAVKGCTLVFHLGALIAIPYSYIHPRDFIQTNVLGTTNVLHAALDSSVERLVQVSTSEVYGTAQYVPIDEKHSLQAQSPYAASKIAADQLALSYYRSFKLPVALIRPFNTYGPRQSARAVVPTIISQALYGKSIFLGSLHPTRDLTYVRDTVAGFLAIAEADAAIGETVNIGTGREVSIGELAQTIIALVGSKAEIRTDERRIRPKQSEVERLLCDASKVKSVIGWEPLYTLEKGLEETIEWIQSHGGLYKVDEYNI